MEPADLLRLLAAAVAGALIGYERELHDKPAGFRTNTLICLGAAVFTLISERVAATTGISDPGRIAAQVVTGVGFLGAGAIIQSRGQVIGLTTAATIWAVASVGMAFGAGLFLVGAVATVFVVAILFGLAHVEQWMSRWRTTARFELKLEPTREAGQHIEELVRSMGLVCERWNIFRGDSIYLGKLRVTGPIARIDELQDALRNVEQVRAVRRRLRAGSFID